MYFNVIQRNLWGRDSALQLGPRPLVSSSSLWLPGPHPEECWGLSLGVSILGGLAASVHFIHPGLWRKACHAKGMGRNPLNSCQRCARWESCLLSSSSVCLKWLRDTSISNKTCHLHGKLVRERSKVEESVASVSAICIYLTAPGACRFQGSLGFAPL